mgnify:CR=1 FL=1
MVYKNEEDIAEMLRAKSGKARMAEISKLVKNVTYCQKQYYGCGTPVSKIKTEIKKNTCTIKIKAELQLTGTSGDDAAGLEGGKKKLVQELTPDIVYDILKNISDIDCKIMGMDPEKSRPEDMILKLFPVPPVQVRPSVRAEFIGSATLEDDLTHKLAELIKHNIRMKIDKEKRNDATAKYANDYWDLLQYHCATYIDNETASLQKCELKGKVLKSLSARLKGR